jgi:hypothetical protein
MNRPHTLSRWGERAFRWTAAGLGGVALFLLLGTPRLPAQQATGKAVPVIEPRLTRIIGSDTLQIYEPALSPDGRWVLFSTVTPAGGGYIYLVSSQGGEVKKLIDDPSMLEPVWFPSGDRIAYWSRANMAIMTVPFDGGAGKLSGPSQRVTLDVALSWFRLSPDGRWIAYRTVPRDGSGLAIEVVPSNGGTTRSVARGGGLLFLMDWSADGRYVYYQARTNDAPSESHVYRVAVQGGAPEEVRQPPTGLSAPPVPYRIRPAAGGSRQGSPLEVQTYDGRPVARIALPRGAQTGQAGRVFTAGGKNVLAVVANTTNPMRLLPIAGGAPRQLGGASADEFPLGWSADGNEVFFAARVNGRQALMSAPVAGGAAREIGPMPDRGPQPEFDNLYPITFSSDGRYLAYSRPNPGSKDRTFIVRPVAGGNERIVTESLAYHDAFRLVGRGGTPNVAGGDFLYLERRGDRVELRATPPQGSSRLIRSFAESDVGISKAKAVFEDRVAYVEYPGSYSGVGPRDASMPPRILVARGPNGTPTEVARVPGVIAYDDIVWSPDGRWIAATTYVNTSPTDYIKVLVVGVTPDGKLSSPPRLLETGTTGSAWGLRWLPDGSAVTLYGQSLPDMRFDDWLVPIRNGGRPVALTRDDRDGIGLCIQSPDGRYVAYRASVEHGTSLWLADLGDALARLH